MHVVIDDSYGPASSSGSRFVTGSRRTHVALVLPDDEVDSYRSEIRACLSTASRLIGEEVGEFHFVDIYNRKAPWGRLVDGANLGVFGAFADIYRLYRWPVHIQTIDDRTLSDHGASFLGKIDGLDMSDRADLSLLFLLFKIKCAYSNELPLHLLVDEGGGKPGRELGREFFHDWVGPFSGRYASSREEPLLQLVDFLAYCINRVTHLALKENRTELDYRFVELVSGMGINCSDLTLKALPIGFTVQQFDELHEADRASKGIGVT